MVTLASLVLPVKAGCLRRLVKLVKFQLAHITDGTAPTVRQLLEFGPRRCALAGIAARRIIDISAAYTDPSARRAEAVRFMIRGRHRG